jgi:hypothetical protein
VAEQERGSHGSRKDVAPDGTERLALLASGPGTVVVGGDPPPPPGTTLDVEVGGTVVLGEDTAGALTAMFDPVTTTTSAPCDARRGEPTSMVVPAPPPGRETRPGS